MGDRPSTIKSTSIPTTRRLVHAFCFRLVLVLVCSATALAACTPTGSGSPAAPSQTLNASFTQIHSQTATPTEVPTSPAQPPTLSFADDESWGKGPLDAAVLLVVYSDFQCLHCRRLMPLFMQLVDLHPDELRLIYRHYPQINIHDKASLAGQAAEAAGAQGAFWLMHDALFDRQQEWIHLEPEAFVPWLTAAAEDLGLDQVRFESDLVSSRYEQLMLDAYAEAVALSIPWTPFLLINGRPFTIETTLNNLEQAVRLALLETRTYTEYPPMQIDIQGEYIARLRLSIGEVVIQLLPASAPLAVNSFVFLAGEGWFDGNIFYRVQPGQYVESGDPSALGFGGPGYYFRTEIDPALNFDNPGMIALSSLGPNTNGSRFFITLKPLPELEGTRTIFGRVISGLELLDSLQARDPIDDLLVPAETVIQSVEIEER
jgi:cyclophilin family peptidyl-prolyl cis-trans isomerase/protein-disulfide isomerase